MRTVFPILFACLLLLAGCRGDGVGDACNVNACGVNSPPDNANTLCEPDAVCPTLTCVGQGQGFGTGNVDQYCTVDCAVNEDCPDGFECTEVANIGQNAGRTLCLKPVQ